MRHFEDPDSQLDKVDLVAMLLDVLQATENDVTSAEAEYEYIHALDLTADALVRVAEAKRYMLEGLPGDHPGDVLKRHIQTLRLRSHTRQKVA